MDSKTAEDLLQMMQAQREQIEQAEFIYKLLRERALFLMAQDPNLQRFVERYPRSHAAAA